MRELVAWLRTTDAGRALWQAYVPNDPCAADGITPQGLAWRSQGIAVENAEQVLNGPLEELQATLGDVLQEGKAGPSKQQGKDKPVKDGEPGGRESPAAPMPEKVAKVATFGEELPQLDSLLRRRSDGYGAR
jgi:hypothetical protein